MASSITALEFDRSGPSEWRFMLGGIEAVFEADSFSSAAGFVDRIAAMADEANHHPDLDLRYPGTVRVRLSTHSAGGLSDLDVSMAAEISRLAVQSGLTVAIGPVSVIEIAIDAMDIQAVRPFWAAILAYRERGTVDLVDPRGIGPAVWFQQMDVPRPQRNRIHLDVSVPHDQAAQRLQDALEAGGVLVSDRHARAFWVLADVEGNEACVSTWQDRD